MRSRNSKQMKRLLKRVMDRDGSVCHYCHIDIEPATVLWDRLCNEYGGLIVGSVEWKEYMTHMATVDHIVPLAHGGTSELTNLVPACRPCNVGRGAARKEWHQAKVAFYG